MLEESQRLASDTAIFEAFSTHVPRITLGEVRVRYADLHRDRTASAADWNVITGNASLQLTAPPLTDGNLLTIDFTRNAAPIVLRATPPAADPARLRTVDRVFVSYQQDRSWMPVRLRIIRDGKVYTTPEPMHMEDIRWTEVELRWPDPAKDALSGRTYRVLQEVGPAPAGAPPFAVEMELQPNSWAGAWWAKISRNYYTAFRQVPFARYFMTSISLAILNIILTVFASSFAAYAFARLDFPGRDFFFILLLATMMIPGQVTMIPSFLIFRELGWYNTLLPLWVPSAFGTAFFIFMMRQFLKTLPKELEEAARIDGCGFLRIYWHIMLPLIRPSLAAVAMFSFQASWNNFMGPLIYVNDERMYNMAFGLFKFQLLSGSSNALMMAGAFVMTLPIIIMFFLFQRVFVQGITLSGVGGR